MKSIFKLYSPFVIGAIALGVGIVLGVIIRDFPYLTFKRDISLGEISSFILTIFVAFFVPFYLDKKINNKRIEKDILISKSDKLDNELFSLREFVETIYTEYKTIKKPDALKIMVRTRRISNILSSLCDCAQVYKDNKNINDILQTLKDNQSNFWNDLTPNLMDRRPKISGDMYMKVEKHFNSYSGNLARLVMYINNL